MPQLTHPLDENTKSLIRGVLAESLPDLIMDVVWNDFFYYLTFFESLDGWGASSVFNFDVSNDPAADKGIQHWTQGVAYLTSGIIQVSAGPGSGAGTVMNKVPMDQPILDFNRPQRFRTQVKIVTVNEIDTYIRIGDPTTTGSNQAHYGFHISETTLKGTCGDGSASNGSIDLLTVAKGDSIIIEARLLPRGKVTFYASKTSIDNIKEVGVLTTPLPTGGIGTPPFPIWMSIEAIAKANASDQGSWTTATGYSVDDVVFEPSFNMYFICTNGHTSGLSTKPGVGGSWEDEWDYFGTHFSFIEYIQRKPQRPQRQST